MTKEEALARIRLLSDEIDANEEENRFMQDEITNLYFFIDGGCDPKDLMSKAELVFIN